MKWVKEAAPDDAAAIARIYNEGIADRIATFETEPRSPSDIVSWFAVGNPVLIAGESDVVCAFAAASQYRPRACYAGVREFSIYVARDARGQGFGRLALSALIEAARQRGWWKLVSRIFPENAASLALCASLGFREVGRYEKHGQLDGKWRDVVIVEKLLI